MSLKIDFDELPYDLFELLELSEDSSIKDVKKAYKKAVLKYHPDKNPDADEEFFSWISLAYKVLSDSENRELYMDWRKWKDDHLRLRELQKKKIEINTSKSYAEFEKDLNEKHGYDESLNKDPLNSSDMAKKLNELRNNRDMLTIPKEDITDMDEAIKKLKKDEEKQKEKDQGIIEYNGKLTTFATSNNVGSLDNFNKLYSSGDNVATSNVTSFNEAFKLTPYQEFVPDNLSLEERMKQYENETKNLKKISKKNKNKNVDFFNFR